jgi:UDP-2,4-diacetamido-2,4,6-trideoxy-beta-L-altropyranose hydrolase
MRSVLLVADAGETVGLGHVSRSSAIAVALRCRGIQVRCVATGVIEPFERDGIAWTPLDGPLPSSGPEGLLVVDSYRLAPAQLVEAARSTRLVVLCDHAELPREPALVVAPAADPRADDRHLLSGLSFAPLRPSFWGLPARTTGDRVRRILVTTGGGRLGEVGCEPAGALVAAFPGVGVALVRGPGATFAVPAGVESVDAPVSLLEPLLAADLVISAAGQTMLEAAACGTPCLALPLVDNQREQAGRLVELGAVRLVDPPTTPAIVDAANELVDDVEARRALSRKAQLAVDGYGALRVAFHLSRLLEEGP